jgi:hypothetical protein
LNEGQRPALRSGLLVPAHHDDRPDLHQISPRLRDAALRRSGNLAAPASPRSCQKSSASFISPAAAIGFPTPSSPPEGQHGQVAVPLRDAVPDGLRSPALVEQLEALQVMELLVVERVVGLRDVDLLPRLA